MTAALLFLLSPRVAASLALQLLMPLLAQPSTALKKGLFDLKSCFFLLRTGIRQRRSTEKEQTQHTITNLDLKRFPDHNTNPALLLRHNVDK